jgi:hypothetical protein
MPKIDSKTIWGNHPYPDSPCSTKHFGNQCAIRMGVALEKSGIDTKSFDNMYPNRRCYKGLAHNPKHILAAQELANWISRNETIFGKVKKFGKVTSADFIGKKGIIFIMNGWGATDHIDIWDGTDMKGGSPFYFSLGEQVWFWKLD